MTIVQQLQKYFRTYPLESSFLLIAFCVPTLYALYTNHIWEDFFITYKFSKNLADGYGLVYTPGEKVHGFTSVINTLLPAFFYWVTQSFHEYLGALWLYRIVSALAFAFAGFVVFRHLKQEEKTPVIAVFFGVLFLFEIKAIAYTANGQEAGFMLLFLLPALIYAFKDIQKNWQLVGLCWAGLFYTRPDAVIYISAISVSLLAFSTDRKLTFTYLFRAGLLTAIIYLPWFIFVWWYYGSPVPHTVIAKSTYLLGQTVDLDRVIDAIGRVLGRIYSPIYEHFGSWPSWIKYLSITITTSASLYWLFPTQDRFGRFLSLFYMLMIIYFIYLTSRVAIFDWYLPPVAITGFIILAKMLVRLLAHFNINQKLAYFSYAVIALAFISIFSMSTYQLHIQQKEVEFGNRMKIGLWLKENVKPGERVFLEPLGYIGFFSQAKMLDYPGLVSPEVVATSKQLGKPHIAYTMLVLKPEWAVLRPNELEELLQVPEIKNNYRPAAVFSAEKRIAEYKNIPGFNYLKFDSIFYVIKRIANPEK